MRYPKNRRPGSGRPANTPEVLWSKVERRGPLECWPWLGFKSAQGYGRTQINGKSYYAHRVIFALTNPGLIGLDAPRDKAAWGFLRHSCDNPSCCNPAHLVVGTHQENMNDKVNRKRSPDFKGERGPRAKLTNKQADEIRWLASLGLASSEMARLYGVSKPTVKSIIRERVY